MIHVPRAVALAFTFGLLACGGQQVEQVDSEVLPRLRTVLDAEHRARFEVTGLDRAVLAGLRTAERSSTEWERSFSLRVGQDSSRLPVAGRYEVTDDLVTFTPAYPLLPGTEYFASADLDRLGAMARVPHGSCAGSVSTRVRIAAPDLKGRWVVTQVYPSADSLPANLLKFYIHFSQPMRPGEAAVHLALIDENGKAVKGAFLLVDDELWDRSARRLTVLLDPGRVKRGLRPNLELGAPLIPGHRYRLRVDPGWRDADNAFLGTGYEKSFLAVEPDRTAPDTRAWHVTTPRGGTRDLIELRFPEPLDQSLLRRMVGVRGPTGSLLPVETTTADNERVLRLSPVRPWVEGLHQVVVKAELEDLAGNTFGRLFDADLSDTTVNSDDELSVVTIPIRIAGWAY